MNLLESPDDLLRFFDVRLGKKNGQGLQLFGVCEPGLYLPQCLKRPDHQAGTDQQHHGQGHLQHYQGVPRAMRLAALAERPSPRAQGACYVGAGIFDGGHDPEKHAGYQGDGQCKQQNQRIDGDILDPRQRGRRDDRQQPQGSICQTEPGDTAGQPEEHALHQEFAADPCGTGAESRANG